MKNHVPPSLLEKGRDKDLQPLFRLNIEDLPSICQAGESHAINGSYDPL